MMTLKEEEESNSRSSESENVSVRETPPKGTPNSPLPQRVQDENSSSNSKLDMPNVPQDAHSTPRPHRRLSTFETVFQVLRRPSASFETLGHLRRGSGPKHSHHDPSRRPSPANGESHHTSHQPSPLAADNFHQQSGSRSLAIPSNHVSFRRPSGIVTFNPDLMNSHQKRYIMGLLQGTSGSDASIPGDVNDSSHKKKFKSKPCKNGNDAFLSVMSAFYAKLLFILGIAFPVTEVISYRVPAKYYQGFYLFLYLGSLAFMSFMYISLLKDKAINQLLKSSLDGADVDIETIQNKRSRNSEHKVERYGSFYLRLGAVAFGIGSMVYSGLEFGQFFELKDDSHCHDLVQAITPATRMVLTLLQMQFIFLNSKQLKMSSHRGIARFGLMHMLAANLCEWLYVIVEETKHEIIHLEHHEPEGNSTKHRRGTNTHDIFECRRGNIMGSLVQDASPFLFPCTIEYSLICAVIMYEMWKTVVSAPEDEIKNPEKRPLSRQSSKGSMDFEKSNHFSVDCSNAHKGLFSGILIVVITIISLIMFFVMNRDEEYQSVATNGLHIWELIMYIITTVAVLCAGWQMRFLKFGLKERKSGVGLDNILLVWAQSGIYIYCMFSSIACYFTMDISAPGGVLTEVLNLIQSSIQTLFILDATFRRTETIEQAHEKPGRQIITFLLVGNMALWLVNTLHKGRAEFRPTHSNIYGPWAWTIISHVSMPLAIFFRFHSTICLFEIWKNAYKFKHEPTRIQLLGAVAEQ